MRVGFMIPMICFVVIAVYGSIWKKLERADSAA
jgi:fucose permease